MMFLPFINFLILFVWLYNYSHTEKNSKIFMKSLFIIFCTCIPMIILQILFSKLLSRYTIVLNIVNACAIYVIPLVLGYSLIKYQKKVIKF